MAAPPPFYAHRFGRRYGPDSSRQALDAALSRPLAGLETDCCLTADDEIVLLHDAHLPDSVGIAGWARERTAADIAGATLLTAGREPSDQHPLVLGELLADARLQDKVVQLEVKAYADPDLAIETAQVVCRMVEQGPLARENVEVISFWPEACRFAAGEGFRTRVIVACAYTPDALAGWAQRHGVSGVILEGPYFDATVVATLREAGLSVMSGVVNDPELARRVAAFGPDAISTDRPHELRDEIAA